MKIKFISIFLFAGYIILSLLLNEFHPFSTYPMYSSFPNYSYTFYVSDAHGNLIPLQEKFTIKADALGHLYTTVCEEHGFKHGNGVETNEELEVIGKEMLAKIIASKNNSLDADSVSIHRIYYHFENENIITDDRKLYTAHVE